MTKPHRTRTVLAFAAMAMALFAGAANAGQIYFDDFSGNATDDLHGTTPDVTTDGETWIARSTYKADGSFTWESYAAMTLAFTPVDGLVYTLDAKIENLTGQHWVQFGFGKGQPSVSTDTNWSGRVWDLLRVAEDGSNSHATFLKDFTGTANWSDLGLLRYDEPLDARIVLDTTGGTGNWLATWYAKADTDVDYTEVRAATVLTDEDIDSIGFTVYNTTKTGQLVSFSLSDNTSGGDANGDGIVDAADYILVKQNMGQAVGVIGEDGDFNRNGEVDWDDLQTLLGAMSGNSAGGSSQVPEPVSLLIMAAGLPVLLKRRRLVAA